MSYFIMPRVTPLYHHFSNQPSISDAFDNTQVQYTNASLHIIRSVFKSQFKHQTKYAKYAFLLLFSIIYLVQSGHILVLRFSLGEMSDNISPSIPGKPSF